MSENISQLKAQLEKSRHEFDIAATCLAQALDAFNQRMERVEQWMLKNQENLPQS